MAVIIGTLAGARQRSSVHCFMLVEVILTDCVLIFTYGLTRGKELHQNCLSLFQKSSEHERRLSCHRLPWRRSQDPLGGRWTKGSPFDSSWEALKQVLRVVEPIGRCVGRQICAESR